jgi:regulator of sigma D
MANRITGHKPGKGDLGLSQFCQDFLLTKSHPIAALYGEVEQLQNLMAKLIQANPEFSSEEQFSPEVEKRLELLTDVFYAFNANLYSHFANPNYHFDERSVQLISDFCDRNMDYASAQDFEIFTHESLLMFNDIRIQIRKVEHIFHIFRQTEPINTFSNNQPHIQDQFAIISLFLNRLSTWAYLEIKIKQAAIDLWDKRPRFWVSAMPDTESFEALF